MGFNIIVKENSVDYPIIKELVNECEFYRVNFKYFQDKIEAYKIEKKIIERLRREIKKIE